MSARKATPTPRGFDNQLAQLEALSASFHAGSPLTAEAIAQLRGALAHSSNFIVAKAARLIAEAGLFPLLPDTLAAYDRFFVDAVKNDPQCWAKNALVKTLVQLEHRQKDAYLRGLRHHQMEPTWGGQSDTAGALRGACTHALVDCPGITDADLLQLLLEPLVDPDKTVRVEAARAFGQVGGSGAALVLRLRALLLPALKAQEEPEVLGAVYAALLAVEGDRAIPLVAAALKEGDDTAAEAAFALADRRTPEALAALMARLRAGADAWFTPVLLSAIALTRLPQAVDFLISLIERDAREAAAAIEAFSRIAPGEALLARIAQAIEQADSPRLAQAMREHLSPRP